MSRRRRSKLFIGNPGRATRITNRRARRSKNNLSKQAHDDGTKTIVIGLIAFCSVAGAVLAGMYILYW